MKYIFFFFFIFIFCSCKNQKYNDIEQIINVDLDNSIIKVSAFITDAEVIKLETHEECLVHRISKIQYINNKIYILDIAHNSLLIFNKNGDFEKKLQKVGNGPGEYIQLMDFFIQDDHIFIMDFTTQSILKYNSDLDYINSFKYNTFGSKFVIKDDLFWIYNEPTGQKDDYQFTCLNQSNTEPNNYLPRVFKTHKHNWGDVNTLFKHKNDLYLSPKHRGIIYHEKNNNLEAIYKIQFSKNNFPEKENINDYDIFDPNFNYVLKENFYVTDDYLIFDYFYNGYRSFCFYDLKNRNTFSNIVENDLLEGFIFSPRWGNANYLIEEVASSYVKEDFYFLSNYNEQLKDINDDDNPVIILYTIKTL
ncbi:MAG: 6-bladed beta-propeller [Tannerella sp.]|jgi:hypothetical protein|nr:6-bladed beta-propeller [Tannerella sp.]